MSWSFPSPRNGFDVGSVLMRSSLLYIFTRHLRIGKNNTLSISMFSGCMEILSSFHFKSKHAIFIKQCFYTIFNDQCNTIRIYIYIFSINQLQFIGHLKLCIFICIKSFKSQIVHFSISLSFYILAPIEFDL